MTHDTHTENTQTEAPATALSSAALSPSETLTAPQDTAPSTPEDSPPRPTQEEAYEAMSKLPPPDDIPLFIGDLLPGLRDAMANARTAYHRGLPDGQDIMYAQAEALDALFVRVLNRATKYINTKGEDVPNYLHEGFINVALRTQRHCRKTIETIAVLREREKLANEMKDAKIERDYKRLAEIKAR